MDFIHFNEISGFIKDNILFILIPLLLACLVLLKPSRKFIKYCFKNTAALIFLIFISFICSLFGCTISLNIFSAAAAVLLGLPGISLALFLSLVIWLYFISWIFYKNFLFDNGFCFRRFHWIHGAIFFVFRLIRSAFLLLLWNKDRRAL